MTDGRKKSGFASMNPEEQRRVARKGGLGVPKEKRAFFKDRALAAEAGSKGGSAKRKSPK